MAAAAEAGAGSDPPAAPFPSSGGRRERQSRGLALPLDPPPLRLLKQIPIWWPSSCSDRKPSLIQASEPRKGSNERERQETRGGPWLLRGRLSAPWWPHRTSVSEPGWHKRATSRFPKKHRTLYFMLFLRVRPIIRKKEMTGPLQEIFSIVKEK